MGYSSDGERSELILTMVIQDAKALESLLDEFSGRLEEGLGRDQLFNKRIAQIMMRHRRFRARILKEIVAFYARD